MATIDEARAWIAERSAELDERRLACQDARVQTMNRDDPEKAKALWDVACWLGSKLRAMGADDETVGRHQFTMGYRLHDSDAVAVAVEIVNGYQQTGSSK